MKRALMVAATLLAAGGGVDAQSNREQYIYWWDWQDGTFWSRTERWVPPSGNPEAVRCVLQNRQTGLTWDGIAYLTGSPPPPARVDTVIVTDTIVVRDTVYLPADTIAEPVPSDTVSLPPDTTIVGRLAASWDPHSWGADVIVQLADSAAGIDVTFSPSSGWMGPPTSPVTGDWTRQTDANGQVGVGWRQYVDGDVMRIWSGPDTISVVVPIDSVLPPVPSPGTLTADSMRIVPAVASIAVVGGSVQLWAVLYDGVTPFVCASRSLGNGWYEVEIDVDTVYERPGGRFHADPDCVAQPLVSR
jgi:hypothetical protein